MQSKWKMNWPLGFTGIRVYISINIYTHIYKFLGLGLTCWSIIGKEGTKKNMIKNMLLELIYDVDPFLNSLQTTHKKGHGSFPTLGPCLNQTGPIIRTREFEDPPPLHLAFNLKSIGNLTGAWGSTVRAHLHSHLASSS